MPPAPSPIPACAAASLLEADASIYPSSLSRHTLAAWLTSASLLSFQYLSEAQAPCGVMVALPLSQGYWADLTAGRIKEWEITEEMFAPPGTIAGVHVWHVEKTNGWEAGWGRFGDQVKRDIEHRLANSRWGFAGYSALCVTDDGRRMFERWGLQEADYKGQVVISNGGETYILERDEWEKDRGAHGERIATCRMYVGGSLGSRTGS